eukprot:scaffold98828_cov16-Tisochrysis_lutea.AAC.1
MLGRRFAAGGAGAACRKRGSFLYTCRFCWGGLSSSRGIDATSGGALEQLHRQMFYHINVCCGWTSMSVVGGHQCLLYLTDSFYTSCKGKIELIAMCMGSPFAAAAAAGDAFKCFHACVFGFFYGLHPSRFWLIHFLAPGVSGAVEVLR